MPAKLVDGELKRPEPLEKREGVRCQHQRSGQFHSQEGNCFGRMRDVQLKAEDRRVGQLEDLGAQGRVLRNEGSDGFD